MITRVWGEINGMDYDPIVETEGNYYFSPPPALTGRYVCQFWAEDEYGNVAHEMAILTIFDGIIKCIEVITREWTVTMLNDGISLAMEPDMWDVKQVPLNCGRDMMEAI